LIGLDLGKIEDVVDDGQKSFPAGPDGFGEHALIRGKPGVEEQAGHADDPVHGRSDFMAHGGEKSAFGPVGRFGLPSGGFRFPECFFKGEFPGFDLLALLFEPAPCVGDEDGGGQVTEEQKQVFLEGTWLCQEGEPDPGRQHVDQCCRQGDDQGLGEVRVRKDEDQGDGCEKKEEKPHLCEIQSP